MKNKIIFSVSYQYLYVWLYVVHIICILYLSLCQMNFCCCTAKTQRVGKIFFFFCTFRYLLCPVWKKYSELLHIWVEPAVRLLAWLSEDVLLIFIAPIHNQSDRHSINFFINKQQTHELTLKIFWSSSTLCTGQPVRFIWWLSL